MNEDKVRTFLRKEETIIVDEVGEAAKLPGEGTFGRMMIVGPYRS